MAGAYLKNPASLFAPCRRVMSFCFLALLACSLGRSHAADSIRCLLADGFDFPVGKPDAEGYYKSRGFWPNGHLGEDWNGRGGGDSDLGDPIYSMGRGIVVLSENVGVGWGNCVIVRHAYRDESGKIEMVDSLYGHLQQRNVKLHQAVERGQQVGTMGSNNGMYYVHLHFEIRKNLRIGMNRSQFARDYSNYYSPTQFINAHRSLQASFQKYEMPVNTFAAYGKSLSADDRSSGSRGLSIPVFPGNSSGYSPGSAVMREPKSDSASATKKTPETPPATSASTPKQTPAPPPPEQPAQEDFWARLKSKLKQGKITDSSGSTPGR